MSGTTGRSGKKVVCYGKGFVLQNRVLSGTRRACLLVPSDSCLLRGYCLWEAKSRTVSRNRTVWISCPRSCNRTFPCLLLRRPCVQVIVIRTHQRGSVICDSSNRSGLVGAAGTRQVETAQRGVCTERVPTCPLHSQKCSPARSSVRSQFPADPAHLTPSDTNADGMRTQARGDLVKFCFVLQIIGCQVRRDPPNSTERYTRWINQLAPDQLLTQVLPPRAS